MTTAVKNTTEIGHAVRGPSTDNKKAKSWNPRAEEFDPLLASNRKLGLAVYARECKEDPISAEIASRLKSGTDDNSDGYKGSESDPPEAVFLIECRDLHTYEPHADAYKGIAHVVQSIPSELSANILGDWVVIRSISGKRGYDTIIDIINWRTGAHLLNTIERRAFTILSEERYVILRVHDSEDNDWPRQKILRFHVRKMHDNSTVAIYELPELTFWGDTDLRDCFSVENAHSILKRKRLDPDVSKTPSRSTLPLCLFVFGFRSSSFSLAIDTRVFFPDIESLSPPLSANRKPDDVIPWSDWGETYTRCFSGNLINSRSLVQGYRVYTGSLADLDFDPDRLTGADREGKTTIEILGNVTTAMRNLVIGVMDAFKTPDVFGVTIETRLAYRAHCDCRNHEKDEK